MKKFILFLCLSTLIACEPALTFAQKGKNKVASSAAPAPCTGLSWQIVGDNHVSYPLQCNDPVVFELRCGVPETWYVMSYPTNDLVFSSGNKTAEGGLYFKTDDTGKATFIFNSNGCLDHNGYFYLSSQNTNGWDVSPGTYDIKVRVGYNLTWFASAPLIVE